MRKTLTLLVGLGVVVGGLGVWQWRLDRKLVSASTQWAGETLEEKKGGDHPSDDGGSSSSRELGHGSSLTRASAATLHLEKNQEQRSSALNEVLLVSKKSGSLLAHKTWSGPLDCQKGSKRSALAEYLATFSPLWSEGSLVYVAPNVEKGDAEYVASLIQPTHLAITRRFNLSATIPQVFVHESPQALRQHACVPQDAVAFYDGAIHLASVGSKAELLVSLRHEYTHHLLSDQGIGLPFWLHEGLAMYFAGDAPTNPWQTWREHPLDQRLMVELIPADATPADVEQRYAQAAIMYEFLERMCLGDEGCGPTELIRALLDDETTAEELFMWGTLERSSGLTAKSPSEFWDGYQTTGDFSPAEKSRLLARTGLHARD